MKTKVTIENGITEVVLVPENDFEKQVIEKAKDSYDESTFTVDFKTKKNFGIHEKHEVRIQLIIKS